MIARWHISDVPRPSDLLRRYPTWLVALGLLLVLVNLVMAARAALGVIAIGDAVDWQAFAEAGRRVARGDDPYQTNLGGVMFRWSPVWAWFMTAAAPLGVAVWRIGQLLSLAFLRDRVLILVALVSWPFWDGMYSGNVTVWVAVAGVAALRGSRIGELVFVALALLIPRPLIVPALLWLLWQRPHVRLPFLVLFAAHGALVVASGWGAEWVQMLVSSTDEGANRFNIGPTSFLGLWWLVLGIPLGAWLTRSGRVGLAGLAITPYVFPHYLLVLLWDVRPTAAVRAIVAPGGKQGA